MQTVILCGGLGLRLRDEAEHRPKPLVEIGGQPILWHLIRSYQHYGFDSFVVALGYKGDLIKQYFLNRRAMAYDFTIKRGWAGEATVEYHDSDELSITATLAETGAQTQTGGRVLECAKYIDGRFCVTYGDGLADVDLRRIVAFHEQHGKLATVTAVQPQSRFGALDIDGDTVVRFAEKPRETGWANAGFFVFEPEALKYFDQGPMETAALEGLARDGQLMAWKHSGWFMGMDTAKEVTHLNELWASGNPPWRCWQ